MRKNRRTDHEAHALVGAYVLDAMDASQRHAFESHLDDCDVCATEVKELQATAALLGEAAEAVPPPGLRSRVLSEIETIRQEPPVLPLVRPSRSRRTHRHPVFAAAAAVLAFAVLLLGSLYAQTSTQLARLEGVAAADVGDDLVVVLSAPDARVNQVMAPAGGSARFVWSGERNLGVLIGDHLQPAPQGQTYALWLISGEHASYVGSFTPGEQGHVAAVVSGDVDSADALGVTVEPPGTITRPTGQLVMSTTLT